jgi:hypothetical protein
VPDPDIDATPCGERMNKQVDGGCEPPEMDGCEPPEEIEGSEPGGGIKFVVTQSDKRQLSARGFTDAQIAELKPEDVSKILAQPRAVERET